MHSRSRLLPAAMAVLLLAAAAFAILASKGTSGCARHSAPAAAGSSGFEGAAVPGAPPAPPFALERIGGGSVSLASLRGRPVVLAFLYSRCGAPCVLIAQQIRGALDELPRGAAEAVIVSADPGGDSAASVRSFLERVGLQGRVRWLTGTAQQLRQVWGAYHVKPASAGRARFADYATVALIDARGHERALYGQEQLTPEALAHDIGRLRAP